jgi:hypothetical protein
MNVSKRNRWSHWRNGSHVMSNRGVRGISTTLDPYLYIAPFQFKLGDVPVDQEVNKLFELFLVHKNQQLVFSH